MRVARPIVLKEETRLDLERNARGRTIAARVVMRSRIVLLAAKGLSESRYCRADEDSATHRESVARALSQTWYSWLVEGCTKARMHSVDSSRDRRPGDRENDTEQTSQCYALVAGHNGPRGRHIRFFGRPYLAN